MYLKNLHLTNFRSYEKLDLEITPGINIFVGKNGEGKTNIVEAIIYLTFLNSHRVANVQPLIKLGQETAYIRSKVSYPNRELEIVLELNAQKPNKATVNQNPVKSQKELFGLLQSIYFSPEDLDLVRGDSSLRRRFLDEFAILKSPKIAALTSDYEKAVKQRNKLIKSRANRESLQPWNEQLSKIGGALITTRISLINEIQPFFVDTYQDISGSSSAKLAYKSSISEPTTNTEANTEQLLTALSNSYQQEIERGFTLFGPHRDDLLLKLEDQPVKTYASHGESWSIALALKLSLFQNIKKSGASPILILDDVFAELDDERRDHLLKIMEDVEQTLITCAVENDIPKSISGKKYYVRTGFVSSYEV